MENEFEILNNLTPTQKAEFAKDIEQLFVEAFIATKGNLSKLKDVAVNMRLNNEVFFKVTFEFDPTFGKKGKGRITSLYQYPNKLAYEAGATMEKNMN